MTAKDDCPSPILQTDRLDIRPIQPDDLAFIVSLRADDAVMREIGDLPTKPDDIAEEVRDAVDDWTRTPSGFWTVLDRASGQRIGQVLLGKRPKITGELDAATALLEGALEIGFLLEPSSWGKGLATEIVAAVLDYARNSLQAKRIVALARETNLASVRLLKRFGFRQQARVPRPGRCVLVFVWQA